MIGRDGMIDSPQRGCGKPETVEQMEPVRNYQESIQLSDAYAARQTS
jgi:hypothetical protein